MNIAMIGIDHSLAPVEIREKFAFTTAAAAAAMANIYTEDVVEGCILLSTCNRTELWLSLSDGDEPDLPALLCRQKQLEPAAYAKYFATRQGRKAVEYLFEMTSGLRSRILGEDQILAQVKTALARAHELQCCGSVLEVLFRSAITGAKKIKSELAIVTANASAVDFAVAQLAAQGMRFEEKKCLVIGNGEMGKRAANALRAQGADVTVTIRQYKSGTVEIPKGCARINYGDRFSLLPECDIVVSATSSPNVTIRASDLEACQLTHDVTLIDLAVPRDIEAAAAELPHVTLYDIDQFDVQQTSELLHQMEQARQMLRQQQERFFSWYECRDLIPAAQRLGDYMAKEVDWRMGQTIKDLGLTKEQNEALVQALEVSSGKVLRKLIFAVRDEAGVEVFRQCVEAMERVSSHE